MNFSPNSQRYGLLQWPVTICTVLYSFYAVWTITTNLITQLALPFNALWFAFVFASLAAVLSFQIRDSVCHLLRAYNCTIPRVSTVNLRQLGTRSKWLSVVVIAVALYFAGIIFFVTRQDFRLIWAELIALSLSGLILIQKRTNARYTAAFPKAHDIEDTSPSDGDGKKFFVLLFVVVGLYFFTSRPDIDDAFYLNLSLNLPLVKHANLASHLNHGVLQMDTMHGQNNWPLMMSTYRLESLAHLTAILAQLTRLPTIYVAHSLIPAIFILLGCATLYVVYSRILAQYWFLACLVHIVLLIGLDGSLQSYVSHGIFRFIHGKGPLITFVVPLVVYLSYVGTKEGSRRIWLALFVVHVCAMGLTANAIYVTPIAMGLCVLSAAIAQLPKPSQFSPWILSSAIYPGLMALFLLIFDPPLASESTDVESIPASIWAIFPTKSLCLSFLTTLFLLGASVFIDRRFRLVSAYALALAFCILNPLLWNYLGNYVTGNLNYRLFWAIPFPTILTIFIVMLWRRSYLIIRIILGITLVAIVFFSLYRANKDSRIDFGLAFRKVHEVEYETARISNLKTPKGYLILAPESVSAWIPTMPQHRYPVVVRPVYLHHLEKSIGQHVLFERRLLHQWIQGEEVDSNRIRSALVNLCVGTIVVDLDARSTNGSLFDFVLETIQNIPREIVEINSRYRMIRLTINNCHDQQKGD